MSLASDLSLSSSKLAGIRRRSDASHGGLLNRMFGSSSLAKEKAETLVLSSSSPSSSATGPTGLTLNTANLGLARDKRLSPRSASFLRSPGDDATTPTPTSATSEKKHRSFSVAKAASFFYSAKETLRFSHRDSTQSPHSPRSALHKLGKMDPALSVPQGSLNNSAGESRPTPRSSFQVGVTEDRNRKCRRTMEDTHAYLYNFMGTPAPGRKASPTPDGGESPTESGSNADDSTHVVETDNGYFAIFDGHAGTFAAEWCGKKLHLILEDIMRRNPNTPVPELLDQAFTSVDRELEKLPLKNSGCTAVAAVLRWEDRMPSSSQSAQASGPAAPAASSSSEGESKQNPESPAQKATLNSQSNAESNPSAVPATPIRQRVLYTANVGDARIVLCRNGKALRLSYDHKGGDENEGRRIANAGGLILNNRVNGVLAVTRALGDAYLKDLVTGHPYTTETVIHPDQDEFLILACDGLWDVCSDQEAVDLIRNIPDAQEASKVLVDHALSRFSTDNLSCMVVRFHADIIRDVMERRLDLIGVEGDPLSKRKGGVSEADKIVDDARRKLDAAAADASVPVYLGLNAKIQEETIDQQQRQQTEEPESPSVRPERSSPAGVHPPIGEAASLAEEKPASPK